MIRLLRWLAVVVVVYFAVTEVIPWIRGRVEGVTHEKIVGRQPGDEGEAEACVKLALEASELVVDESRNAVPPPGDSSPWVDAAPTIRRQINAAEDACACDQPACRTAGEALSEIRALVNDLDLLIGGQVTFSGGLVQRQERIGELLERARVEAR